MQDIIVSLIDHFGYIGVFLLILLENIFPPIPSEIILTFGGFMVAYSSLNIMGVIISSTLGSVIGALFLYYIGSILNIELIHKFLQTKLGKLTKLKIQDIEKSFEWFNNKGSSTVFFCRFIPVVRSLISIPAGMSGMSLMPFFIYTICGSASWNALIIFLGYIAGDRWDLWANVISHYSHLILFFILFFLILLIMVKNIRKNNS